MAMREDCCHYESRAYDDDGEVARFCTLGLAPEAPWRCPDNCASYERIVMIGSDFEAGFPCAHPAGGARTRRGARRHRRCPRRCRGDRARRGTGCDRRDGQEAHTMVAAPAIRP